MILRSTIVLTCLVVGIYSLGGMLTTLEFKAFEDMCFQNDPNDLFKINGQDNPLANSLENFIALAEKFEAVNTDLPLKDELFYFLKNYNYENIKLTTQGASNWKPDVADFREIDKMWEPDLVGMKNRLISLQNPFTDAEKCSLYHMISHSIVDKPEDLPAMRSMGNDSHSRSVYRTELKIEEYFPQEIGVVAVRGSEEAVSLSRVLVGMYVGLNENRQRDIKSFRRVELADLPDDRLPSEREVDPLHILTLAEVMMLSSWTMSNRRGLSRDGSWVAFPSDTSRFCPMVYKPQDVHPAYSYATVRGAADGLILGSVIDSIERKKQTAKLSQVLRMYYSWEGITVEPDSSKYQQLPSRGRISVCNRQEAVEVFSGGLEAQMKLYGVLVSEKFEFQKNFDAAKNLYQSRKDVIYRIDNKDLQEYCAQLLTPEDVDHLTRETFLDVIVVMESSTEEVNFKTQQLITGYLASYMDLRYSGSRMTIFLDQRISTDSSSATIELKSVVSDEYSSSCAACKVGQIAFQRSTIERDQVVQAVDQLLDQRSTNETKMNGANGKVVVFFNFQSDNVRDNRIQGRLDQALRDLFTRHRDTKVYAVGSESEILKKYARNDYRSIVSTSEGSEEEVAKKLYKLISLDSGLLQYSECDNGRGENSAGYENFVSPYAIQHWMMPPKYFYKSKYLKVTFEAPNGAVKVCHNRVTAKPENEGKFCNVTSNNNRVELLMPNPCISLTQDTCSPFNFAVIGMGPNGDSRDNRQRDYCNDMNDKLCNRLDSIKFKVTHEGVRCSGCMELVAPTLITLLTVLLSYSLQKLF